MDDCSNLLLDVAYCVDGGVEFFSAFEAQPTLDAHSADDFFGKREGASPPDVVVPRGPAPTQNAQGGGVAIGWPGVHSPKLRQQMGLDAREGE